MDLRKNTAVFLTGGSAYVALELLWRGRSHGAMFLAGGASLLLIGGLEQTRLRPSAKILAGAGIITAVELGTGLAVNRDHRIWDYRGRAGNLLGQICPAYCLAWVPVSALAGGLFRFLDRRMDTEMPA